MHTHTHTRMRARAQPTNNNNNNWCRHEWSVVVAALCAGLYPNICRLDVGGGKFKKGAYYTKDHGKLEPHPSSVNAGMPCRSPSIMPISLCYADLPLSCFVVWVHFLFRQVSMIPTLPSRLLSIISSIACSRLHHQSFASSVCHP